MNAATNRSRTAKCAEISVLDALARNLDTLPPLSPAEERQVCRRVATGDEAAKELLFRSNLRFVLKRAALFVRGRKNSMPLEDAFQEGCLGLMGAIERFDPCRNVRFLTYAGYWIDLAMQRAAPKALIVYVPPSVIRNAMPDRDGGRSDQQEALASKARHAMMLVRVSDLLDDDQRLTDLWDSLCPTRLIFDPSVDEPEHEENLDRARVLIGRLRPREREVIECRFGLATQDGKPEALDAIGRRLGVTKERVRQIEKQAIRRLREMAGRLESPKEA